MTRLCQRGRAQSRLPITLIACERRQRQLTELAADPRGEPLGAAAGQAGVMLTLAGNGILNTPAVLAGIDGVTSIRQLDEDPD